MRMTRSLKRLSTVGSAVVALTALALAPALATGNSYTVAVGGSTAPGWHPITADDNDGVVFEVQNPATGGISTMTCTDVHILNPDAEVQSGTSVTDIARFSNSTWNGCDFNGIALRVTQTSTWYIHGTGAATSGTSDVIAGHVDGVHARVESVFPGLCSFDVAGPAGNTADGLAEGSFDEATQTLNVNESGFDGHLTVWNVTGCSSAFADGDPADFTQGNFAISSPDGAINVQ